MGKHFPPFITAALWNDLLELRSRGKNVALIFHAFLPFLRRGEIQELGETREVAKFFNLRAQDCEGIYDSSVLQFLRPDSRGNLDLQKIKESSYAISWERQNPDLHLHFLKGREIFQNPALSRVMRFQQSPEVLVTSERGWKLGDPLPWLFSLSDFKDKNSELAISPSQGGFSNELLGSTLGYYRKVLSAHEFYLGNRLRAGKLNSSDHGQRIASLRALEKDPYSPQVQKKAWVEAATQGQGKGGFHPPLLRENFAGLGRENLTAQGYGDLALIREVFERHFPAARPLPSNLEKEALRGGEMLLGKGYLTEEW